MATLLPTASACHSLQLPPTEKDDRLNLNVRTGSASTLYKSLVFTYGGLTMGLELRDYTIEEIRDVFQSKINTSASRYKTFDKYLSGELFYLSLIERTWTRLTYKDPYSPRPSPRLLHQLCAVRNCIYLFGGLTIPENQTNENFLVPCNDLWEFNLEKNKWTCLHDGSNYEKDKSIPCPRYNHKITPISSLKFVNRDDHFGIFIGGGRDNQSNSIYDNAIFDLVEKKYVGSEPIHLSMTTGKKDKDEETGLNNFISNENHLINVDITTSMLVDFVEEVDKNPKFDLTGKFTSGTTTQEESLVIYTSTKQEAFNPLASFKLSKTVKHGKALPIHRKKTAKRDTNVTIPFNLKYPSGGLFGQNIVITGFLEDEYDISIFIYNKPTGKWSRMNIFCNHDYGSHRFWGGFAWQSHHKVVLLGNYLTSRTTSSIRFFTLMITVSLPVTNVLASSELAGGHHHAPDGTRIYHQAGEDSSDECLTDSSHSDSGELEIPTSPTDSAKRKQSIASTGTGKSSHTAISFSEYVHYAAPKQTFTTIRSVFPPAAITLGRNAFDRYGDLVSDFEIVSSNGDRIPVCLVVLMERWGRYFISLLSRGYVQAVDKFESDQAAGSYSGQRLRSKASNSSSSNSSMSSTSKMKLSASGSSVLSNEGSQQEQATPAKEEPEKKSKLHLAMNLQNVPKDAPTFRLPFQEPSASSSNTSLGHTSEKVPSPDPNGRPNLASYSSGVDPHQVSTGRKGSVASIHSNTSSLLASHLQDIPAQLPLPAEPIPAVPVTSSFRSSSRKNSQDHSSPRASLIHTLTALRNIPSSKSPRDSPFGSPRASISAQGNVIGASGSADLFGSPFPNLRPNPGRSPRRKSTDILESNQQEKSPDRENESKQTSVFSPISENTDTTRDTSVSNDVKDSDQYAPPSISNLAIDPKFAERVFENALLNFEDIEADKFRMEPSLIPRRLYLPWPTVTVKAFCEYLYTGQIGNKWILAPTVLDNLLIAKFFRVPLLYDLISEVLFGIIGRKEAYIVGEGNKLKKKYFKVLEEIGIEPDPNFQFPLDEYEGFMDTVDDGYLDIALLKKTSRIHRKSTMSTLRSTSTNFSLIRSDSIEAQLASADASPKVGSYNDNDENDEISDDSKRSIEVEQEYSLGYLDTYEKAMPQFGSRSKSVFDKHSFLLQELERAELEKDGETNKVDGDSEDNNANYTLEELISPTAPIPTDYCIDLIFEASTIVTDLKLMLRAANLKAMTKIFKRTKADIEIAMGELEYQKGVSTATKGSVAPTREGSSGVSGDKDVALSTGGAGDNVAASTNTSAATGVSSSNVGASTSIDSSGTAGSVDSSVGVLASIDAAMETVEKEHSEQSESECSPSLRSLSGSRDHVGVGGVVRSAGNGSNSELRGGTPLRPSSSKDSVNTQKSHKTSLSRSTSHSSLRGLGGFTSFGKNRKAELSSDLTSLDKLTSDKSTSSFGMTKFRTSILRRPGDEYPESTASSIKSGIPGSIASATSGVPNRRHGLFHIGHRKKDTSGDESSLEYAKLERAPSEVSINSANSKSDSANSGNGGKRIFGFRLKKSH